jgi:hypothetical protein
MEKLAHRAAAELQCNLRVKNPESPAAMAIAGACRAQARKEMGIARLVADFRSIRGERLCLRDGRIAKAGGGGTYRTAKANAASMCSAEAFV